MRQLVCVCVCVCVCVAVCVLGADANSLRFIACDQVPRNYFRIVIWRGLRHRPAVKRRDNARQAMEPAVRQLPNWRCGSAPRTMIRTVVLSKTCVY